MDRPPRLIGFMRHGRVRAAASIHDLATIELYDGDDGSTRADLTRLGDALAEVMDGQPEAIERLIVVHEPTEHAQATAGALTTAYNTARAIRWHDAPRASIIDPPSAGPSPYAEASAQREWINRWKAAMRTSPAAGDGDPTFLLVIGHDPRMSMLARAVVLGDEGSDGWTWPNALRDRMRPPLPALSHTELLVCRRTDRGRYRARWTFGPTTAEADAELRSKVKSKMDTAKVFAGVLTAVATFAANNIGSTDTVDRALALTGLGLLGLSIVLYLVTMFHYDALLMPRRFWRVQPGTGTRSGDAGSHVLDNRLIRPPSSGTLVLYQNMVLIWSRVFVPATFLAGMGLALFVEGISELPSPSYHAAFWVGVMAVVAAATSIGRWGRPRLGTQD